MGDVVSMHEGGKAVLARRGTWESMCAELLIAAGMWPEEAIEEVVGLEKTLGHGISPESAASSVLARKGLATRDDGFDLA